VEMTKIKGFKNPKKMVLKLDWRFYF
jgi:hypothetical protein